jgi:alkylated DNA repair dioxygenase AlkB
MSSKSDSKAPESTLISDQKPPASPNLMRKESLESFHTGAGDESSSFQVSISSHTSTPFDSILLTQAQDLRADVDNIKMNICSQMKVDLEKFALVTPLGIKQCNTLNKFTLATGLLALLGHSERVCATVSGSRLMEVAPKESSSPPRPTSQNSKSSDEILLSIQKSLTELKDDSKQETMFRSIEEKLADLKLSLSQYRKRSGSDASTPDGLSVPAPPHAFEFLANKPNKCELRNDAQQHIETYSEDFIGAPLATNLLEFLESKSDEFSDNSENGHEVLSFGQPYRYPGAKAVNPTATELPEPISEVAKLLKEKFPDCTVNQCLINKYRDKDSFLPEHADDESSIVHGSNIFTLSLGGHCDVKFRRRSNEAEEKVQTVSANSVYVMTRDSQNTWKHRIDTSTEPRELRYSITFRYISNNNTNSTIIIGDSNTRFLKFGSGKGTFGDQLPGKRVLAYKIDQITPTVCHGFKNVFVHCGINDIRQNNACVQHCANQLIRKLDQICEACPSSKITVSPILPTKLHHLNQRAKQFNQILFNYINKYNPRIGSLDFNCFVDENNLLDKRFGRYRDQSDPIHLGSTGVFTLSRLIINKVRSSPSDGRQYSHVLAGKVTKPRALNPMST